MFLVRRRCLRPRLSSRGFAIHAVSFRGRLVPLGHCSQTLAPGSENSSSGHESHSVEPPAETSFCPHDVHGPKRRRPEVSA